MTDDARVTRRRARANGEEMMAVETAPAGTRETEDAVDVGVERDATTTTMHGKKSANDRGDEGGGRDEEGTK